MACSYGFDARHAGLLVWPVEHMRHDACRAPACSQLDFRMVFAPCPGRHPAEAHAAGALARLPWLGLEIVTLFDGSHIVASHHGPVACSSSGRVVHSGAACQQLDYIQGLPIHTILEARDAMYIVAHHPTASMHKVTSGAVGVDCTVPAPRGCLSMRCHDVLLSDGVVSRVAWSSGGVASYARRELLM